MHTPHAGSDRSDRLEDRLGLISIHTPHAGSDAVTYQHLVFAIRISIHTPHAGSDVMSQYGGRKFTVFQSTLPMRGATTVLRQSSRPRHISIHTPHAGSDQKGGKHNGSNQYFNPHSPCGERLLRHASCLMS